VLVLGPDALIEEAISLADCIAQLIYCQTRWKLLPNLAARFRRRSGDRQESGGRPGRPPYNESNSHY
jgi:hypothetical protein